MYDFSHWKKKNLFKNIQRKKHELKIDFNNKQQREKQSKRITNSIELLFSSNAEKTASRFLEFAQWFIGSNHITWYALNTFDRIEFFFTNIKRNGILNGINGTTYLTTFYRCCMGTVQSMGTYPHHTENLSFQTNKQTQTHTYTLTNHGERQQKWENENEME